MISKKAAIWAVSVCMVWASGAMCPGAFAAGKALAAPAVSEMRDNNSIIVDGKVFAATQNCEGENWKFDASTRTLSLNGYNGNYIDLGTQESVTVEVSGSNLIESYVDAPALMVSGDMTITGDGDLTLETYGGHAALHSQEGSITVSGVAVIIQSKIDTESTDYLISAPGAITFSGRAVQIYDTVVSMGGAIGTTSDITISDGTYVNIETNAKGIAATEGAVYIDGSETSVSISSVDQSIYAKNGLSITGGVTLNVHSLMEAGTAVFSPNGDIRIESSDVHIECQKTALAGQYIILSDAYLANPLDGAIREVSSMKTILVGEEVASVVEILRGTAPEPTPTLSPTTRPITPVPTKAPSDDFLAATVTWRRILGAALLVLGLGTVIVIVVRKVREKNRY